MKPWQIRLQRALARDDAPPVLSRDLIARFATSARGGEPVPTSSLTHWLRQAVVTGCLRTVQRGLYLNEFRRTPGQLADTVPFLKPDAVVSLNTVLGDAGVLNNPVNSITAVVPMDAGAAPLSLGRLETQAGALHFFGIPRRIIESGMLQDRTETAAHFAYPRATPEKALVDWLYLARSPRSHRSPPPKGDMDMELINVPRLRRLAQAAGISDYVDAWLK